MAIGQAGPASPVRVCIHAWLQNTQTVLACKSNPSQPEGTSALLTKHRGIAMASLPRRLYTHCTANIGPLAELTSACIGINFLSLPVNYYCTRSQRIELVLPLCVCKTLLFIRSIEC